MTLHLDDARWRAAVEAELLGEATSEQQALLATHRPQGAEHRAEQALLAALADPDANEDERDQVLYDELLDAVVQTWVDQAPRRRSRVVPLALAGVTGVAAALVATVLLTRSEPPQANAEAPGPVARGAESLAPAPVEPLPPRAIASAPPGWTIASGAATRDDDPTPLVERLPLGTVVVASVPLCAQRGQTRACLGEASRFEATQDAIELLEGEAELRSEALAEASLGLGELAIEPAPFSTVVVRRSVAGWSVRVDRGQAEVIESRGRRMVLAGETLERALPSKAPTTAAERPSANELLRQARSKRREGDLEGALSTYEKIVRLHPKNPTARIAAVSIGQLRLSKGDAEEARQAFRRYLDGGPGALSEDAAYGEIRALRALGRAAEAERATRELLARYPESQYGAKLRP